MKTKSKIQERPILFKPEMVKAILEGRKTQTRRIIRDQELVEPNPDDGSANFVHSPRCPSYCDYACAGPDGYCPYGQPGDHLWVKERWSPVECSREPKNACDSFEGSHVNYAADFLDQPPYGKSIRWKSSLYMPRWASRLTLEIVQVRVQRVKDISEGDAIAEGVGAWRDNWSRREAAEAFIRGTEARVETKNAKTAKRLFYLLWQKINTKRGHGWDKNPWVWVIEFERV